jgi:MIP family channel proteins
LVFRRYTKIHNETTRQFLAETLGTFILSVIGMSAVAQFKFLASANKNQTTMLPVQLAVGLGAFLGITTVGRVSGGHLNPALSLSMCLTGRLSLLKFLVYSIGQYLGAFLAACVVHVLYLDAMRVYPSTGGMHSSMDLASIFATYPNEHLSLFGAFFDQTLGSIMLVVLFLSVNDQTNDRFSHVVIAAAVGGCLTALGTAFAFNAGCAVNPARDFSPRLFTLMAGWGARTFTSHGFFFWIPWLAPYLGSVLGTLIYILFISSHW